jgi:hypothetical protein
VKRQPAILRLWPAAPHLQVISGHYFEVNESIVRALTHSIMRSFAVLRLTPQKRCTLATFRPCGQLGQP